MKSSVLVATYQRPSFLKQCLDSLIQQSQLPDEVVVVVRQTDEATLECLHAFVKSTPEAFLVLPYAKGEEEEQQGVPIRVAYVESPGIVAAENCGMQVAKNEVIALIDDDAIALPNWLEEIMAHYQDPKVGAVGGPAIPYLEGKPQIQYITGPCLRKTWYGAHRGDTEKIPDALKEVHSLRGCNMSFRRELIQGIDSKLKPYWRRFEEDITLSIHQQQYKVLYDPQVCVYHYTAPIQEGKTRDQDPVSIFGSHHNNTYVMLKYVRSWRKCAFLGFTFLIGDRWNLGVLGYMAKGVVKKKPLACSQELYWALRGKASALASYQAWLREQHSTGIAS